MDRDPSQAPSLSPRDELSRADGGSRADMSGAMSAQASGRRAGQVSPTSYRTHLAPGHLRRRSPTPTIMVALHALALGSCLLAFHAYAVSLPTDAQAVLGLPAVPAPYDADEYLFPSEIRAREEHAGYQLWRISLRAEEDAEEDERFMEALDVDDMASYISRMIKVRSLGRSIRLTLTSQPTQLFDLDVWQSTHTHMDILLPSPETQQRFLALLPPRYADAVQIVIRDFPALYESQAAQVAALSASYDDVASDTPGEPTFSDILRSGKGKGRKGRKKGRKHRKPAPTPMPPQPPTEPAPLPPPPPVGSNRTTPDIYNTTDLATLFHDAYHPLSVLYDFMDELQVTYGTGAWEGTVTVFTLGMSAEGREIRGIKLHKAREGSRLQPEEEKGRKVRGKGRKAKALAGEPAEEKMQEIYMQGGQHAREVRPSPDPRSGLG